MDKNIHICRKRGNCHEYFRHCRNAKKGRNRLSRIIGIAGTAKNTGKTTTLKAVMERAFSAGLKLGLTSIGYDGEVVDNVTGLPKPRVEVAEGTLAAIAKRCMEAGTARIEVLTETTIRTPLGVIVIGKVVKPGLLVVAGPNKSSELKAVNTLLREYGCELIMVDGALNRLAPMVETDGLLLATGAARTQDINKLAAETYALAQILNLPVCKASGLTFQANSLLTEAMVRELLACISPTVQMVQINGLIGAHCFRLLLEEGRELLAGKVLVLPDPIKILVAGEPCGLFRIIKELNKQDILICVKKEVNLVAITINPFFPKYRFESHDYEPSYVDKLELKKALAAKSLVPVVNVLEDGIEEVWQAIWQ